MADPRSLAPSRLAEQRLVFSGRVGRLQIVARSRDWRALHASTKVYVIVSRVAGAPAARDVALFMVRRRGPSTRESNVIFSIANARADMGSFWVCGVDGLGYADIFHVRDILATAVSTGLGI